MADSTVTVVGNLTRDPELRFTSGGRGQASFGLAVSRRYQVNNEWQEQTSFFNVVAWGSLGENAAASLTKGTRIIVTGRLEQRSYETKEGEKRSVVEIIADEIGPSLRWARAEIERTTDHDVIAFVSQVAETVGEDGRYLHLGLTSSDVVDTGLALQLRDAAVVVPEPAIMVNADKAMLYVVDQDMNAQLRPVKLGVRSAGVVEILSGVEAGQLVIVEGVQKVRPGAKVKPAGPEAAAVYQPKAAAKSN